MQGSRPHEMRWMFGIGLVATGPASGQIEFDLPVFLPSDSPDAEATDFRVADLDRDAFPDLVVLLENGEVLVRFNDAGRGLDPPVFIGHPTGFEREQLVVFDHDGDGDDDVAIADGTRLQVLFNEGRRRFTGPEVVPFETDGSFTTYIPADLDRRGGEDLIISTRPQGRRTGLEGRLNDGAGGFVPTVIIEGHSGDSIVRSPIVGDLDGDGDLDVAAAIVDRDCPRYGTNMYEMTVRTFTNDGDGGFVLRTDTPMPSLVLRDRSMDLITAGDFDNDGDVDLAGTVVTDPCAFLSPEPFVVKPLINEDGGRAIIVGEDGDPFGTGEPNGLATADFDLDGRLDLLVLNARERLAWILPGVDDPSISFGTPLPVVFPVGRADEYLVAVVDMTGDGLVDLVTEGSGEAAIVRNVTVLAGPRFEAGPFVRGEPTRFVARGITPGREVVFVGSFEGPGLTTGIAGLDGIILDLAPPLEVVGNAVAGKDGSARLVRRAPDDARTGTFATQAVVVPGPDRAPSKSAVVEKPIVDP